MKPEQQETRPTNKNTPSSRNIAGGTQLEAALWEMVRVPLLALAFIFFVTTCNNALQYKETLSSLQQEAERGNAEAQFNLGNMYSNGQGVMKDFIKAYKWYRQAANQGQAEAQLLLGQTYHSGRIMAQDYREAIKWYQKAAEQGRAEAQFYLGSIYYNGEGGLRDQQKGCKLIQSSAENGYIEAIDLYNKVCLR